MKMKRFLAILVMGVLVLNSVAHASVIQNRLVNQIMPSEQLNFEIFNSNFKRFSKMVEESSKKECSLVSWTQNPNGYTLNIISKGWGNGVWYVKVYPLNYKDDVENAPKGGFWFGLYDLNKNRIGTARVSKRMEAVYE